MDMNTFKDLTIRMFCFKKKHNNMGKLSNDSLYRTNNNMPKLRTDETTIFT